jgi:hypothetical protein
MQLRQVTERAVEGRDDRQLLPRCNVKHFGGDMHFRIDGREARVQKSAQLKGEVSVKHLLKAIGIITIVLLGAMPAAANGGFAVTNMPVGAFAGWAATANVKILVGDFNGDGRADIALIGASGWATMPVAFSNGDGTYNVTNLPITNFATWAATPNVQAIVGDFNGDGLADVALVGGAGWATVPVAFSNGDGTFNVTNLPIANFAVWAATPNVKVLVGDFNGDGKADIALTGGAGWATLPVAFSNGDGTFNVTNLPITNFATWATSANVKVLVGDFNGDGKADIALTGVSGWATLPVAFSNGNGTFNVTNQPIANFAGWAATANAHALVGDFNGDGLADVALTGPSGWATLPVAFSQGNGNFVVTNQPIDSFAGWATSANVKILVGDFNGDGLADVALTGPSGWATLPVAFSNGNGAFTVTNQPIVEFAGWAANANAHAVVGDVNGDGKADVALLGGTGWATLPVAFSLSSAAAVVNMVPATLSGETNQDSEPFLAVNPDSPRRMVGTAFTPNPAGCGTTAPIYVSQNGGFTWVLNNTLPSCSTVTGTGDVTHAPARAATGNRLYTGILKIPGSLLLNELTTGDFTSSTVMSLLGSRSQIDQPFVQAQRVSSVDHVFIGVNDFAAAPKTATVDVSANGGATWNSVRIEKRNTCGQDLPSVRPAAATDGTVYVAFLHCTTWQTSVDVVVVRDDTWGTGANPFTALVDPGDGLPGKRVVTGTTIPWINGPAMGNNRIGSTLSLAVDPGNSDIVYVSWADRVGTGDIYTVHVRRSTDRGVTWSGDLMTVTNATNVALAIGAGGTVGVLYQQVTGSGASQRWVNTLVQSKNGFLTRQTTILATVPAAPPAAPNPTFQPYIGDYDYLVAVGSEFRGIFSANNAPNLANFPQGVIYQRQVDFTTQTLKNGSATVPISIDPFFFRVPMVK